MLRALRGNRSQRTVSRETGIPQPTVSGLEAGRTADPLFGIIVKLARYYGVTPTDMAVMAGLWSEPDPEENSQLTHEAQIVVRDIVWQLQQESIGDQRYFAGHLRGTLNAERDRLDIGATLQDEQSPLPAYLRKRFSAED